MVMYMYVAPGQGTDNPMGSKCFQKHKSYVNMVICWFFPLNDFVTVFPIQIHMQPDLPCCKISQGQPRVIIYINFADKKSSSMLHAQFQDHIGLLKIKRRRFYKAFKNFFFSRFLPYMGVVAILVM